MVGTAAGMSNFSDETIGADDLTRPSNPKSSSGVDAHTLISTPTVAFEDLLQEKLLITAPRIRMGDKTVPALGGIPLIAKLGQGGMGAVYFGFHPRLKVDVAVKVLPSRLAARSPELVKRFFREAQIAAKVKSPHLVSVIDVNDEGGLFFLVMEYVSGTSAGSYLKKLIQAGENRYDELTALDVCIAAVQGLAAAHDEGVIHRDIKPDNILIPKAKIGETLLYKSAKLADLGLARTDEAGPELTGAQSVMGTPGYMAPEQANDAKSAGKPADVFSMGAALYAMLAGCAPFEGKSAMTTIVATIQQPHRPVTQINPGVTPRTEALIDRCLEKDPAKRFPDASALLAELRACHAPFDPEAAKTLALPAPEAPHHAASRNAKRALYAGIAMLVIGGLFLLRSGARQREVEKMLADEEARRNGDLAARNEDEKKRADEAKKLADDQAQNSATMRETAIASQGVAMRAAAEASHKMDDLRNAIANEKRAKDESEKLQQEFKDAQDAEHKASTEAESRAEDLKIARRQAKFAEDISNRTHTPISIKNFAEKKDTLKTAEAANDKAQSELSARQSALKKADESAKTAAAAITKATEDRLKAEKPADLASRDATRLIDAAQAAAKAQNFPPERMLELMPLYKLADGPYIVESLDETIHDPSRSKDLQLRLYYPRTDKACPVIIFSHSAFGSRENFYLLGQFWASHGYICIHPTHAESADLLKQKDYGMEWLKALAADPKNWENRARDISFIIDAFPRLRNKNPVLRWKLDPKHIGVAGHAYGAFTAQLSGGATVDVPGEKAKNFGDKRVDAVLLLAPDGRFPQGLNDDSWKNFTLPMMDITGSLDKGPFGRAADWRQEPFKFSPAGDKYLALIDEAHHALGGIMGTGKIEGLFGPESAEVRDLVKIASVAFWDAYLKEDPKAKAYLKSNALQSYSKNKVSLKMK